MNGIGPRNFNPNMKADLAKQVKELAKLDEGKALGEAQQANTDRPEGDTEVNKTIKVYFYRPNGGPNGDGGFAGIEYNGVDNGIIEYYYIDGTPIDCEINPEDHDAYRDLWF